MKTLIVLILTLTAVTTAHAGGWDTKKFWQDQATWSGGDSGN